MLFEGLCFHHKYTFKLEEALHKYLPIFLSDVKARHDRMVELVERMLMWADGLQLTARRE